MKILALDISSVGTGFSIIQDGAISEIYGVIAPNKKCSLGEKLLYFEKEIKRIINENTPDNIITEDIFCFNKITFKCLAEYRGVAFKTIFELTGHDPYSLMAVEARKIMGVGTKKEEAFAGIIKLYNLKGFNFDTDNDIVDSFCLGLAYHKILTGTCPAEQPKSRKKKTRRKKRKTK